MSGKAPLRFDPAKHPGIHIRQLERGRLGSQLAKCLVDINSHDSVLRSTGYTRGLTISLKLGGVFLGARQKRIAEGLVFATTTMLAASLAGVIGSFMIHQQ